MYASKRCTTYFATLEHSQEWYFKTNDHIFIPTILFNRQFSQSYHHSIQSLSISPSLQSITVHLQIFTFYLSNHPLIYPSIYQTIHQSIRSRSLQYRYLVRVQLRKDLKTHDLYLIWILNKLLIHSRLVILCRCNRCWWSCQVNSRSKRNGQDLTINVGWVYHRYKWWYVLSMA